MPSFLVRLAAISLIGAPGFAWPANAWVQDVVSPAIHYAQRSYVTRFTPNLPRPSSTGAVPTPWRITGVHVRRDFNGQEPVQTQLCREGRTRCVPLTGRQLYTRAFNGLDAREPMYLVHTVPGEGPLPQPIFIKVGITVHYGEQG